MELRPLGKSLGAMWCYCVLRESKSRIASAARFCAQACRVLGPKRSLKVAFISVPNAGKSTLINRLIGQKVFAVSPKIHTTQRRALGVFTVDDTQVTVLDTPGVPSAWGPKLKLGETFMKDPYRSMLEAQLVLVMVDVSDNNKRRESLDPNIVRLLKHNTHLPSALVLNKVDLVRMKHQLLSVAADLTRTFHPEQERVIGREELEKGDDKCWPFFQEVFMISALTGDGVEKLKSFLVSSASTGEWEYDVDTVTDQPDQLLVEDIIREKLFLHLDKEIPYVITQDTVVWEENHEGVLVIHKHLNCRSSMQVSIVIGAGGRIIQSIVAEAKEDIECLLQRPVDLTLVARFK